MSSLNPQNRIDLLTGVSQAELWQRTCARVLEINPGDFRHLPIWIVPDGRHKAQAALDLLALSGKPAFPTGNIHTLLSFAAELLQLPLYDVSIGTPSAILILKSLLEEDCPAEYQPSLNSPGFLRSLWATIEAVESNGWFSPDPDSAKRVPRALREIHRRFHHQLNEINRLTAGEMLRQGIAVLSQPGTPGFDLPDMVIGPFLHPTTLELRFIRALSQSVGHCLLVPSCGPYWIEQVIYPVQGLPSAESFSTPVRLHRSRTSEHELEDIFAYIADLRQSGIIDCYRDVRLIHPFIKEAFPRIKAAAQRFDVPVTTSVPQPLSGHPLFQLTLKLIDLFDSGWDRPVLLQVLRTRLIDCDVEIKSTFIRAILEGCYPAYQTCSADLWLKIAGEILAEQPDRLVSELQKYTDLDETGKPQLTGREFGRWIRECCRLTGFSTEEHADRAWKAFEPILCHVETHFVSSHQRRSWIGHLKQAAKACNYIAATEGDDAVEICSYEQENHLPVHTLIYADLNSRIPASRPINPFCEALPGGDYQEEFRRFQAQIGNATGQVLLCCPRFDEKGSELALSPLIKSLEGQVEITEDALPAAPAFVIESKAEGTRSVRAQKQIITAGTKLLENSVQSWSPTRLVEAYQCRYLYFARYILRATPLTDRLAEGVTPLLIGSLAHKALELYLRGEIGQEMTDMERWVRQEFERRMRVFEPHLEADRELEELVQALRVFVSKGGREIMTGYQAREFELSLRDDQALLIPLRDRTVQIEGQIDRIDQRGDRDCIIIDYKLGKLDSQKKNEFYQSMHDGLNPQLPLYSLMVQDKLQSQPLAIFQYHIRSAALMGFMLPEAGELQPGWQTDSKIWELDKKGWEELIEKAIGQMDKASSMIAGGDIKVQPRDYNRCGPGRCDYADLCRYRERWMSY